MNGSNATIITDPGIDDMVALVLLNRICPDTPKTLISTFGNHSVQNTAVNAKALVEHFGLGWKHIIGAAIPKNGKLPKVWRDNRNGAQGTWGYKPPPQPAARVSLNTQAVTQDVISLAPLTELAKMVEAGVASNVLIMGCQFSKQEPEFNIELDIESAKLLLESEGIEITIVSADAAKNIYWDYSDICRIPETTSTNVWLKQLLKAGFENGIYSSKQPFVLYDPLTVYLGFYPTEAKWINRGIEVIDKGPKRGCTVFSDRYPKRSIALSVNDPTGLSAKLFDVIFGVEVM